MEYRVYISWNGSPMSRKHFTTTSSLDDARRIADDVFYTTFCKLVEVGMINGSLIHPCVYCKQRP